VCGGDDFDPHRDRIQPSALPLDERLLHDRAHVRAVGDGDHDVVCPDGGAGDLRPVQNQVRQPREQERVLLGEQVPGGPVGHQQRRTIGGQHGAHLRRDREPGAATAPQPAVGDQLCGRRAHRVRPWVRHPTVYREVLGQPHRLAVGAGRGQQPGHGRSGRRGRRRPAVVAPLAGGPFTG